MTLNAQPLVIRNPEDLVAAVPYMLGFHPNDSLVVMGNGGPYGTCALRFDSPRSTREADEIAGHVADMLMHNEFTEALLVGYGREQDVAPSVMAARMALAERDIVVKEAVRVEQDRWWSYLCADPGCCPRDGTPFDIATTVVAAEATMAGQVALPGRAALTATVAPTVGPERERIRQATERAERQLLEDRPNQEAGRFPLIEDGTRFVQDLFERDDDGPLTDDAIAQLGVLCTHVRVRDEAWVRTDPHRHLELWRDMTRRVEQRYLAAPASILAYTAFISGDGALANVALDRALEAAPEYSMAHLLRELVQLGVPPQQARLRMTPEDLAAAWDAQKVAVPDRTDKTDIA